ncbi:DUF1796 family putative cysteine peptidase [Mangrovicoccus sp. HB161399]|uniref:DUF1796 family putative cysteine peptidase n=1 Tax=Mangrovicoccus sp. HB161399 TaxID=2720392 RepID=UPI001553C0EB|nr:DUF1796 family putative cysteine peptidase [Mangrovicoccus sp. HB161399]
MAVRLDNPDLGTALAELHALAAAHDWDGLAAACRSHIAALEEIDGPVPHVNFQRWLMEYAEQTAIGPDTLGGLAARIGGAAAERQRFRETHAAALSRGTYVSMGCECHPWVILNRWGFRDSLSDLNPFCLGLHRMPHLLELLESRFALYAQPENLSTRIHAASQQPLVVDDTHGVTWNHHRGEIWTADGFARFRAHQAELIGAFHAASSRPGAIHVMSRWINFRPERSAGQIGRLLQAIADAGAASPRLILMDFERDKLPPGIHRIAPEVQVISRPYPAGYQWSGIASYNSPEGAEWERSVMSDFAETVG